MLDQTDFEIIKLLKANGRIQFRDIGEMVHLTGQAVSNRITRMEQLGIIKGYSVVLDERLLGKSLTAFVTIFMKTTNHTALRTFLQNNEHVIEADRISGEGCYLLKVQVASHSILTQFLDRILEFGNYRLNLSIDKIKQ